MSVVSLSAHRRKKLRRALMGAAAAATLGGAGLADAQVGAAYATEASGPASFADIDLGEAMAGVRS